MVRSVWRGVCLAIVLCLPAVVEAQNASEDLLSRGIHTFHRGRYSAAHELLTAAISAGSEDPQAFYYRGLSSLRLGQTDDATQDFQAGAQLELRTGSSAFVAGRSLERIQGRDRLLLQRIRTQARVMNTPQREQQQLANSNVPASAPATESVPSESVTRTPPPPMPPAESDPFAPKTPAPATPPAPTTPMPPADPFAPKPAPATPMPPLSTPPADPFAPKPAAPAPTATPAPATPAPATPAPATPAPATPTPPADPFAPKPATPAPATTTPAAATPAATTPAATVVVDVKLPAEPDAAVRELFNLLAQGKPQQVWQAALPPKYQQDIESLVQGFGAKMDPELWSKGFAVLGKAAKVIKDKKDFIFAHPLVMGAISQLPAEQQASVEEGKVQLVAGMTALEGLLTSEISTVDGLKTLKMNEFLAGSVTKFMQQALALSAAAQGKSVDEYSAAQLAKTKISLVSTDADDAEITLEAENAPPANIKLKRVDGRWLPAELVDAWDAQLAMAKLAIEGLDLSEQKPQVLGVASLVETTLDGLLAAQDQDAFNAAIGAVTTLVEQFLPKPAAPPPGNNNGNNN